MPGPQAKAPIRRAAPRAYLAERALVDKLHAGLTSVAGAREIILLLQTRRVVSKLLLGHNKLGDEGCQLLFRYLSSGRGRQHRVKEISLNSNGIGDIGLAAIAEYLQGNEDIRELFLQNNAFKGEPSIVTRFCVAINSSGLQLLSLATNNQLSNSFLNLFLSDLNSPTLRELHISALGLSSASQYPLAAFISSPRSHALDTLKCNGNTLGLRAVHRIVQAVLKHNTSLVKLEVFANSLSEKNGSSELGPGDSDEKEDIAAIRKSWESDLKKVLLRNELLRKRVHDEALRLLPYARVLLLNSQARASTDPSANHNIQDVNDTLVFRFRTLPSELQSHTLSFLAPILSPSQLLRIFTYASSTSTLPALLPKLSLGPGSFSSSHSNACIPDPSSLAFDLTSFPRSSSICSSGRCMGMGGSVSCRRVEERSRWLHAVGCFRFELLEGEDIDVVSLLS